MSIKHSKYKNTGILFELLTRQVVSDALNGNKNSKALTIIERYFSKSRELGKELILYRSFFNGKTLSESKALDYINALVEQRKKLDIKKLSEERYSLVKDIKDNYDLKEFLSNRVPSYKIYASIYKTFESSVSGFGIEDVEDVSESKYTLVEHLNGNITNRNEKIESEVVNTLREQEEDLRLLTYKIMLEKFNDKYKILNVPQKTLLREYINNMSNYAYMIDYVKREANRLSESLSEKSKKVVSDVIRIKLEEVCHQLNEFQGLNAVKSNHLTALMIGYELEKQLSQFQGNE